MQILKRIIAVFFSILVVLLLVAGVMLLSIRTTVLNPAFIQDLLLSQGIYNRLPEILTQIALEQLSDQDWAAANALEDRFGQQALTDFVAALIPPSWVQQQSEQNIVALFAWLDSDEEYPDLRLNLGDVGQQIVSDQGRDAVRILLDRLPPCGPDDDFISEDDFLPQCRPSEQELDESMDEVLPTLISKFPDEATLNPDTVDVSDLDEIRQIYRLLMQGSVWTWVAALILLGLALLLAARNLPQAINMVGWPLLIGGILGTVLPGGLSVAGLDFVVQAMTAPLAVASLPTWAVALLAALLHAITGYALTVAAVLIGLGLLGVIVAALLRRHRAAA